MFFFFFHLRDPYQWEAGHARLELGGTLGAGHWGAGPKYSCGAALGLMN